MINVLHRIPHLDANVLRSQAALFFSTSVLFSYTDNCIVNESKNLMRYFDNPVNNILYNLKIT